MQIGVGLPTGVPGTNGRLVIEWAHRADEGPFSSLGVVDRLAYDSYEPLTALAVAAGVTRRVKLATTLRCAPEPRRLLIRRRLPWYSIRYAPQ